MRNNRQQSTIPQVSLRVRLYRHIQRTLPLLSALLGMGPTASKSIKPPPLRSETPRASAASSSPRSEQSASDEPKSSLPIPAPALSQSTSAEGPQHIVYAWSHNEAVFPGETYSPAQYIRSFALIHLRYLERRCISWPQLVSSSILPRHQFHPMYVAYRAVLRSGDSDKGLDLYLAFTNVIFEYGFQMDPVGPVYDLHGFSVLILSHIKHTRS